MEHYKICLAIQRALLDRVTANLRLVSFLSEQHQIDIYFYYDGECGELEEEFAGDATAEVIADSIEPLEKIDYNLLSVPYPKKIDPIGHIVFCRYEDRKKIYEMWVKNGAL